MLNSNTWNCLTVFKQMSTNNLFENSYLQNIHLQIIYIGFSIK